MVFSFLRLAFGGLFWLIFMLYLCNNKKRRIGLSYIYLFSVGLTAMFFGFFLFVNKAESARIALTPLVFEIIGEKGEKIEEYHIRVMNPSYEETIVVAMEVEDIFPEGDEGRVRLEVPPEERNTFSLSSWITFEPETLTLLPREEKPVKFVINVPRNAEPGGHYAGILARTETIGASGGVGVGIVQRIASLVLLTVSGDMKENLSVADFKSSKSYYEYGPVTFTARFENTGTVHLRPQTLITVSNFFGKKVAEIPLEARNVLPDAVRKIDTQLSQKWFWAGRYTAVLSGTYGKDNLQIYPETIVFWAFPWKVGLVLFLFLLFIILTRKRWATALKILIKGESAFPKK